MGENIDITSLTPEEIQNNRASHQSWLGKLVNGMIKGVILTATTAVDACAGVVGGAGNVAVQIVKGNVYYGSDVLVALAVNPVSAWLQNINMQAETHLPNHYSTYEQNDYQNYCWDRHVFGEGAASFWEDHFLKNISLSIGAALVDIDVIPESYNINTFDKFLKLFRGMTQEQTDAKYKEVVDAVAKMKELEAVLNTPREQNNGYNAYLSKRAAQHKTHDEIMSYDDWRAAALDRKYGSDKSHNLRHYRNMYKHLKRKYSRFADIISSSPTYEEALIKYVRFAGIVSNSPACEEAYIRVMWHDLDSLSSSSE